MAYRDRALRMTHADVNGGDVSSSSNPHAHLEWELQFTTAVRGGFSRIRILGAPEQGAPAVSEGAPTSLGGGTSLHHLLIKGLTWPVLGAILGAPDCLPTFTFGT
jgi:hypothetical protein